ncbi:peroxisomal succinyl-coenzyme A thioesterase-like [Syngnathus acus]|uniref:peroxisomal succinyl-coenzyme A thioesterase-like n=1 Tax=Syngnathus acus TaxID=161584 RepID=UPI0018861C35|nr:peroxisomal succinyl-coenzyme A thioesterase-like [Syngnathus acus]XP_037109788.1 peroxisomal succinyl-coenzyme A thioesterase-like [Syngnathus acus]
MSSLQCSVQLSVRPSRCLVDEKLTILVHSAPPSAHLTLRAFHRCEDGHGWEAYAHYLTDVAGSFNATKDPSLGGTYTGVEQMGLFWSIRPVPGSQPGLRMRKKNVQIPMEFTISVYQDHLSDFVDRVPLASQVLERWYVAPGVLRTPVTGQELTATLFLPAGPGPFPAILDLWGGGGQLVEYRAALFASHGFAAMALDYMTPKITLETGKMVDNTYFEKAFAFLQRHPRVLAERVAMLGLSFGVSVMLKMAAYSPVLKPRCVVSISGSHVQPVEGTIADILSYFDQNGHKAQLNDKNEAIMRTLLLPIPTDPAFKVDMGRVQCPLLVVAGEDDQNWPACESAEDMKKMMEQAGNIHLLSVVSYPQAGHLLEPPYSPHTRVSSFRSAGTREKLTALWGGECAAHSLAQEDAWRKTLDFLRHHLYA